MSARRAFIYDFLAARGGAESLALHVRRNLADLDLITAYIDRRAFSLDEVSAAQCQALTSATRLYGWHALKAINAFRRRAAYIERYEQVVFSGYYAPLAVAHRQGLRNLYYCHTPPRFAYDLEAYYLERTPPPLRPLQRQWAAWLRKHYAQALASMEQVAANSRTVQRRLEQFLGLQEVLVIHPPVETDAFSWQPPGDYYLSCARLEPYKRVDLLIRAFQQMPGRKLVVASGGSDAARLQALAAGHDNISFTGWLSAERMQALVAGCIATLYLARDEDFGISPVESMAAGKPVLGAASGGLLETMLPGETGLLVSEEDLGGPAGQATEAICAALGQLGPAASRRMRRACEQRAARFDRRVFEQRFRAFLANEKTG